MTSTHKTELPSGWTWTTVGDVSLVNPRSFLVSTADDELVSFVPMAAVEAATGRMHAKETRPYRDVKRGYTPFSEGDILFAKITPCMENGKVAIANQLEGGRGCGSTEFHVLRLHNGLSIRLMMYYLLQDEFREEARQHMTGSAGQLRVPAHHLAEAPFPLPPFPEQHRIVAEVDKQFTRLDASVASLRRAQANLKRYRASVLKTACEGKLVHTESELARQQGRDYEPASMLLDRILKEHRARWEAQENRRGQYKEPAAPDTSGLPELPEGWSYVSLEPLMSIDRSGMKTGPFGSLLKKHEHKESGVPVLGIENIREMEFVPGNKIFITPSKAQELAAYDVLAGDILISRSGTVGEACVVPDGVGDARISTNLMRLSLADAYTLPQFLCLLFNGSPAVLNRVSELCSGSTRDFLNGGILRSIAFPIPPIAEQHRIVSEVERHLSVIQAAENIVGANLKRAERLRQSILKQAFSGKLVPQDPKDEPASALLERTRRDWEQHQSTTRGRKVRTGQ